MSTGTNVKLKVTDPFVHPALFYRGEQEYLAGTLTFVRAALAAGDPVAVAVPGRRLELLRGALGAEADRVHMLDMQIAGRNPGHIIPGVLRAFADAHPGAGRVWIIGEPIWAGRSSLEYPACVQHEALINLAFVGRTVSILCPYDAEALDPVVLTDAAATHPVLVGGGGERVSDAYAPEEIVQAYNQPLPQARPAFGAVAVLAFDARNLTQVRRFAAEEAARVGLAANRIGELEVAINELAANSLVHGGGSGVLRVWADSDHLICEISDTGHLTDPLAGRRPAGLSSRGGRGLLLVHHICDLLRIHTTPAGTAIRSHFALSG
ncbi:anti-sigma factor RsbA family regulatory protein [Actinomadura scrupuli]|uniref:anti-sigma factor RsbA family regulatory protein n=1 Tax=Actinomadura scrupuli TaxID=559629 RepID=UPI003D990896